MPKAKAAKIWERDELDWYIEPIRATASLLSRETFDGPIWDPCCGGGNIIRAFLAAGYQDVIIGTDLVDRGAPCFAGVRDFLTSAEPALAPNLIFNPPFFRAVGAESFIRHALALATGKVAAFVDIKFLASQSRANGLWREHPPTRVWILSERPSCPPGSMLAAGGSAKSGTADWIWAVWDLAAPTNHIALDWLRSPPTRGAP